ncbi:bifunctional helix-turn-helix transcriptional regulator/GNAT family N-acetyltransferase [Arcobacter sp. LA11]|uniref:bifunctional helix-turn-helix transcriptional regulator/GNAT family N-acetyltransferase n=1 Tax=Arcobacter sp. LA11 TaxID=1898176 RepID=UPI0009FAAA41|nr:bifunctional helix-turn-helix transcriptional regulator/GNAT family N-acetyltransferase [Arcobacter sp. LA11]
MNNLFDKTGVMAIGTRLRMLSERLAKDAEKMFELYNVDIKQKWYPVVFSLSQDKNPKTVTEIANEIGQSHVSVVKIIREMSKAGMLIEKKDKTDGRKTNISLSDIGKEKIAGLDSQHGDVTIAVQNMLSGMEYNLWHALDEFEELLDEKSTFPRVLEVQRKRENEKVEIVNFENKYAKDFKKFNEQWINRYFEMEEKDKNILENPKKYILDDGGIILVALYEKEVAGFCGLMKSEDETYDYELTKMTVRSELQGKGIGLSLGNVIIQKARELGGKSIFLQSNTVLNPAITLYKKLGFKKVVGYSHPYERSNIQMSLILS